MNIGRSVSHAGNITESWICRLPTNVLYRNNFAVQFLRKHSICTRVLVAPLKSQSVTVICFVLVYHGQLERLWFLSLLVFLLFVNTRT
jgi:hypothetical protein